MSLRIVFGCESTVVELIAHEMLRLLFHFLVVPWLLWCVDVDYRDCIQYWVHGAKRGIGSGWKSTIFNRFDTCNVSKWSNVGQRLLLILETGQFEQGTVRIANWLDILTCKAIYDVILKAQLLNWLHMKCWDFYFISWLFHDCSDMLM